MPDKENSNQSSEIHDVLAHSYLTYFFAVVFGLIVDMMLPIKLISDSVASSIGLVLMLLAPALILWAQMTSNRFSKEKKEGDTINFSKGPYIFSRSPTHLGLDILVIGFGLILNSFFIVAFSIVSFFVTRFFFVRKEEALLGEKYGEQYLKYRRSVRAWL
jgi:protein-S-isoprenylcysteine O-methyltransferase Ste14